MHCFQKVHEANPNTPDGPLVSTVELCLWKEAKYGWRVRPYCCMSVFEGGVTHPRSPMRLDLCVIVLLALIEDKKACTMLCYARIGARQ